MKKNNKGFSLVELIVVVLIMGILAVALTPQVMKWVDKSRIAADKDTLQAVKSAAALAYTSKDVYGKGKVEIKLGGTQSFTATPATGVSATDFKFAETFKSYAGGEVASFTFKKTTYTVTLKYDEKGILDQSITGTDSALLAAEISDN